MTSTPDNDKKISQAQLDKAVPTLIHIERTDDRPLYRKVRRAIDLKKRQRRRLIFARVSAAVVIPLAIAAGVWLFTRQSGGYLLPSQVVSITMPNDNRTIAITGEQAGLPIEMQMPVIVADADGKLKLESADAVDIEQVLLTYQTLNVPRGNHYDMVLEDGTHIWLNAGSRISFPTVFADNERRVYVEGEVCFDVTQDENRPFIVDSRHQSVTVLGTFFNINSYSDQLYSVTTLVRGSVMVKEHILGKSEVLRPRQQLELNASTGTSVIRDANISEAMAWLNGLINMEKQNLRQVTDNLSRLYNVDFDFRDPAAAEIRYRGNVSRSEDIDEVLNNLSSVSPVEFRRKGDVIEIRMK